jgi:hypothetical protein
MTVVVRSFEAPSMTLTVKLAEQDQKRWEAIASAMNATSQSDAIRILINDKFASLQADKTLVERRGGHPKYLLESDPDLSTRSNRKSAVAEKIAAKALNALR